MFCCKLSLSRRRKLTHKRLTAMLIILLVVLVCLHLVIIPSASGGYNDECYLTDQKRQNLRIMVQNISRVFDKFGVQYWLDYGEFYYSFSNRIRYTKHTYILSCYSFSKKIKQAKMARHIYFAGLQFVHKIR